jgi:hypothetical protein
MGAHEQVLSSRCGIANRSNIVKNLPPSITNQCGCFDISAEVAIRAWWERDQLMPICQPSYVKRYAAKVKCVRPWQDGTRQDGLRP